MVGARIMHPQTATVQVHGGVRCWLLEPAAWASGQPDPVESLVSADERARGARFVHERDRVRHLERWVAVRSILAGELGCLPAEVEFSRSATGKPSVRRPATGLHFSVASSGPLVLLAVAPRPVGVDLERVRIELATADAAAMVLTPRELRAWGDLAPTERAEAFFRCWTRKEAWAKASGVGLGGGVERAEICFTHVPGLVSFVPASGHIAALQVTGAGP